MENVKKNQIILVSTVVMLLLTVIITSVVLVIKKRNDVTIETKAKFKQIYASDYDLHVLGDNYYFGTYDNKISVFIDNNGKELYKCLVELAYDGIYKTKDNKYIIYSNKDNKFIVYLFDGKTLEKKYELNDINNVKPIIYKNNNLEYIIGFYDEEDNIINIYNFENHDAKVIKDAKLICDKKTNIGCYTYNENYLIVKNLENLYGVIDINGKRIIDYKYYDLINTYDNSFIALNKKDKYGVIDVNDDVLLKFKYLAIEAYEYGYLIVNKNNKLGLFDKDYNNITGFNMNYNKIDFNLRSKSSFDLYHINDNKYVVVNNRLENYNNIEYKYHNLYYIVDGKIDKKIKQVGFGSSDFIYTYDDNFKVSFYDTNMDIVSIVLLKDVVKINSINEINNEIFEINYIDVNNNELIKYYDYNGSLSQISYNDLVYKTDKYYGYLKKNDELLSFIVKDSENKELGKITGRKIIVNGDFLIVDNGIYQIEVL